MLAWTPWAVVWGDAFLGAAQSGQSYAEGLLENTPLPTQQGNAIVVPGGTVSFETLFPGSSEGSHSTFTSVFGNNEATNIEGQKAQHDLLHESAPHGAAYRAMRSSVDRPRPDMRNDPLWGQLDDTLTNLGEISKTFADCETLTSFKTNTRKAHIPDYKTCERIEPLSYTCDVYHDLQLPAHSLPFNTSDGMHTMTTAREQAQALLNEAQHELETYGNTYNLAYNTAIMERDNAAAALAAAYDAIWEERELLEIALDAAQDKVDSYLNGGSNSYNAGYQKALLKRNNAAAALQSASDYNVIVKQSGITHFSWSGDPSRISSASLGVSGSFNCQGIRAGANANIISTPAQMQSGSANARDYLKGKLWYFIGNNNQGDVVDVCQATYAFTLNVTYLPKTTPLKDEWGKPGCLQDAIAAQSSSFCKASTTCLSQYPVSNNCYTTLGVEVCENHLVTPPVTGISKWCTHARVEADCNGFGTGQMGCYTDTDGVQQCHNVTSVGQGDCAALEADPNCGFIKSECVDGAKDTSGRCFAYEETWDCGALGTIPVLERIQSVECAGPVRCLGTECASSEFEQSQDFGKAAALLQAAQNMINDMDCDPNGRCIVFSGEAQECKRAVGGIVNCCKTPDGVSLTNYLALMFAVGKIDSAIMGMEKANQIRGAWEVLRSPVTETGEVIQSTWSAVKEGFTSVANSLTGSTTAATTEAAGQGILAGAKQKLLTETVKWGAEIFGESAVNLLFSGGQGTTAAVSNGTIMPGLQLGGGAAWLGTAMAWVMWAYMIYSVAMILIKLIWKCEQEEFELGAKRELKACHRIGHYCKQKILGWCVEKRDSYCCFNTPIARILNEQIRPQLGRGWGEPKHPDCTGIDVQDFDRIDWDKVNLDEWLAMLYASDILPEAGEFGIDDLTGNGSLLADGTDRPDAWERTDARTTGTDAEDTRMTAEDEIFDDTLGALPDLPENVVDTFYQDTFGRAATEDEIAFWRDELGEDITPDQLQERVNTGALSGSVRLQSWDPGSYSASTLNATSFEHWTVTSGSVDVKRHNDDQWHMLCLYASNTCLDMDGSTSQAGTIRTRTPRAWSPGRYILSFYVSGSQRSGSPTDTMVVSVDGIMQRTITKNYDDPFTQVLMEFVLTETSEISVEFSHVGGDNEGIVLDEITINRAD